MEIRINKIIPPTITLIIIAVAAFLLISSIRFLSKQINGLFVIDESKVEANTIKLDLETYRIAEERLNIKSEPQAEPEITESQI